MGAHLVRSYVTNPDTEPDPLKAPGFAPDLGFAERKERGKCNDRAFIAEIQNNIEDILLKTQVMVATQEQMNQAQLPIEQRDYCAHHLLKLMKCKRDNWPNFLACKHERHDWDYCEHQE
ncbi:NDUB7 dehydrogenase, partial [Polyodon spathula]|nr:NDUB7 dehydrogenase [Polyodon spathula]